MESYPCVHCGISTTSKYGGGHDDPVHRCCSTCVEKPHPIIVTDNEKQVSISAFQVEAAKLGTLLTKKNQAYGSAYAKVGTFLALLYPDGMRVDQYASAMLLVRIFDKQMRIATSPDAFAEDPFMDIAGYGILGSVNGRKPETK